MKKTNPSIQVLSGPRSMSTREIASALSSLLGKNVNYVLPGRNIFTIHGGNGEDFSKMKKARFAVKLLVDE